MALLLHTNMLTGFLLNVTFCAADVAIKMRLLDTRTQFVTPDDFD
jgi:hypothetical protein